MRRCSVHVMQRCPSRRGSEPRQLHRALKARCRLSGPCSSPSPRGCRCISCLRSHPLLFGGCTGLLVDGLPGGPPLSRASPWGEVFRAPESNPHSFQRRSTVLVAELLPSAFLSVAYVGLGLLGPSQTPVPMRCLDRGRHASERESAVLLALWQLLDNLSEKYATRHFYLMR